jgi:hypothetical protein
MAPVNAVEKQGSRFQKGRSGNPNGRPKGSRNRTTLACEALLEEEAGSLTRKAIELAKNGDTIALRLCLDRIYPVRKDRLVRFTVPQISSPRDAADVAVAVAKAVAAGEITPDEGYEFTKMVDSYVRAYHTAELDERVAYVEQLSDADLMRIAMGGQAVEAVTPVSRLLTVRPR